MSDFYQDILCLVKVLLVLNQTCCPTTIQHSRPEAERRKTLRVLEASRELLLLAGMPHIEVPLNRNIERRINVIIKRLKTPWEIAKAFEIVAIHNLDFPQSYAHVCDTFLIGCSTRLSRDTSQEAIKALDWLRKRHTEGTRSMLENMALVQKSLQRKRQSSPEKHSPKKKNPLHKVSRLIRDENPSFPLSNFCVLA